MKAKQNRRQLVMWHHPVSDRSPPDRPGQLRRRRVGLVLALLCCTLAGCRERTIETTYGRRRGIGASSVNGTAVLGSMFEKAGWSVSSWRRLSPKLEKEDVLLWAPDRFGPPEPTEVQYLERWLAAERNRTMVYVGRDYDASLAYWQAILPRTPSTQRLEIRKRLAQAESEHMARRYEANGSATIDWFEPDLAGQPTWVSNLSGPWADGLDPSQSQIWLHTDFDFPNLPAAADREGDGDGEDEEDDWQGGTKVRPLLTSGSRVLAAEVTRARWNGSKLIVVANGSWLLNLPLVNPQHQILASRLVQSCGAPRRICFLESGTTPLTVQTSDTQPPLMLQAFQVWPLNALMLHLVFLGVLYGFAVYPIFGRPKQLPSDRVSDFGKHVSAVGELLERGQDVSYAEAQLQQYREAVQGK